MGRVSRTVGPAGTTDYARDESGKIVRLTAPEGAYRFERDRLGRIVRKSFPNGRNDLRIYDPAGRVAAEFFMTRDVARGKFDDSVLLGMAGSPIPDRVGYAGFAADLRKAFALTRPFLEAVENAGRLEDLSLNLYDGAGNLKASLGKDERTFYEYDSEDRLTKSYGDGNRFASYEYDAAGNVTKKRIRRLVSTYRYDPTGRITSARETAYAGKIPEGFDPSLVREHYRVRQAFGKGWQDDFLAPAETTYHYDAAGNLARETTRNAGAGLRVEKRYEHDGPGRLTEVVAEGGATRHFAYDGLDRKVFSGRRGGNFHAYGTLALYDGRRSVYEQDSRGKKHGTRTWLPLDEELTGEVLHRSVAGGNPEFVSREHLPEATASMSMHVDRLGSTVFAADRYGKALIKYAYSEFGEVYVRKRGLGGRFVPHTARVPEEVLNRETVNRLYTGGTQEQLSGLVHLDVRHYSPAKTKFVQPDPYSLTELSLPEEARHTLVKAAGLTLEGLLADPSQQLGNSYVSNNPLKWTDPLGLSQTVPRFFAGIGYSAGVGKAVDDATGNENRSRPRNGLYSIAGSALAAATFGASFTPLGAATSFISGLFTNGAFDAFTGKFGSKTLDSFGNFANDVWNGVKAAARKIAENLGMSSRRSKSCA